MIVTDVEPPAATVPLVGLPEKFTIPTPGGGLGMLHVNVLFPLLLMVSVAVALVPTCTSPNASSPVVLPDSEMMRVGVGAVGEQELVTAPTASRATTNTPDHHQRRQLALDVTHAVPVDEQRVDVLVPGELPHLIQREAHAGARRPTLVLLYLHRYS